MSKYSEKVKRLQAVQTALIVVCILGIAIFFAYRFKPKITNYDVKDECGPIGGAISHSIDDEDSCRNACAAYCLSLEKEFSKSSFKENLEACHDCSCSCKS